MKRSPDFFDSLRSLAISAPLRFLCALLIFTGEAHTEDAGFIKGITISAQGSGREWQTPEMAAALDEVKALGANAFSIHPYAQIQTDGGLRFSPEPEPDYIAKPLDWARERGLRVMLIPHIAYWGTPFAWRGEIDFDKPEKWNRFFDDYEKWITLMARVAEKHGAEIFCIGLEYERAQKFEARWRQIIAAVRREFHRKITYGANWDGIDRVPFWDAVDYIGMQAYFPLCTSEDPTPEQLEKGWKLWMLKLDSISKYYRKPLLFTEIGYNENTRCAIEPWEYSLKGGEKGQQVQARCIEQALQLAQKYPCLAGMFWWKWFPNLPDRGWGRGRRENFDLRMPALKALIAKYWLQPAQADKQARN